MALSERQRRLEFLKNELREGRISRREFKQQRKKEGLLPLHRPGQPASQAAARMGKAIDEQETKPKPIFTAETLEAQKRLKKGVSAESKLKADVDKSGKIVGLEDPYLKQSYAIMPGSLEHQDIRRIETERQIYKEQKQLLYNGSKHRGYSNNTGRVVGKSSILLSGSMGTLQTDSISQKETYFLGYSKRETGIKGLATSISRAGKELYFKAKHRTTNPISRQLQTYTSFGLSFIGGLAVAATHPIGTIKGTVHDILHPRQAIGRTVEGLLIEPPVTAGELTGGMVIGHVAGKIGGKVKSKVKIQSVDLPTKSGSKTFYKGLTVAEKPIVGVSEGKLTLGKPKITGETVAFEKFIPETKLETTIARDVAAQKYTPTELAKFDIGLRLIEETRTVRSKYKNPFPSETKTLSPRGVQEVIKFAKQEDALLYGSFTADAQLPSGALAKGRGTPAGKPTIGDIDLQLKVGPEIAKLRAAELTSNLQSIGEPVRLSKSKPTLIETRTGHHAVDIHAITESLDADIPTEGALGYKFYQKPEKIQGVEAMRLGEFGHRKGASVYTFRKSSFAPEPHRMKDIPDFFTSQEYLLRSKGGDLTNLNRLRDIYASEGMLTRGGKVKVLLSEPRLKVSTKLSLPVSTSPSLNYQTSLPLYLSSSVSPSVVSPSTYLRTSQAPSKPSSISKSTAPIYPSTYIYSYTSPSVSPSNYLSPSIQASAKPSVSPSPSPSLGPSLPTNIGFSSPISPPSFNLPDFSLDFDMGKKKRKGAKQKTKYLPDLPSLFFDIKGEMPKFSTPLTRRPIV